MRVLLVVPSVPYPLVSGGHHRDWQILNLLTRIGIKPHLLYFGAGEGYLLAPGTPLEPLCASIAFGGCRDETPDRGRFATLGRKLGYLTGFGGETFPFSYQYDAINAGDGILEAARGVSAEVVIVRSFWCHHAPALKAAGIKIIANCPDFNTQLAWEMVRTVRGPWRKFGPLCNYIGVRRQERTFLPTCDEVWVPTESEADALKEMALLEKKLVMPNVLDSDAYPDYSAERDDGATMLFVANYGYAPNANAARLLLTEIFPAVRARTPSARLVMVGRGLPAELARVAEGTAAIELPGFVDDLRPYYRRAALVLLPVLQGAGMMIKTLEALMYGKAAVGFQQSFRGLASEKDPPFTTVDA